MQQAKRLVCARINRHTATQEIRADLGDLDAERFGQRVFIEGVENFRRRLTRKNGFSWAHSRFS